MWWPIIRIHTYFNIFEPLRIFKVWSTHHISYLTTCMMLLISTLDLFYSHSEFKVFIIFRLNNMYDVVPHNSTYTRITRKISMIRLRTLKYSLEGCVFALLAALSVLLMSHFFCKCNNNYDWLFDSIESFISIVIFFLKLWI